MTKCRICSESISPFLDLGRMPLANAFLTAEQFDDEYFFNLAVGFCTHCEMVQLLEQPPRERMFHQDYAFFSGTSQHMQAHFRAMAEQTMSSPSWNATDPLVVEIGCNDGILLQHFAARGCRHVGIEPSENVAEVARADHGLNVITEFFDLDLADRIVAEHGQADLILAANVMCHISTFSTVAESIRRLLKPRGVFVFEDPYLGDIVRQVSYDQIYDEHVFFFSVSSLQNAFARHGLEVVDAQPQNVHGGSMRYTIAHQGAWSESPRVVGQRAVESTMGLERIETYAQFRGCVEQSRDRLMNELQQLRDQGKRVVGYGATSKSTTITNYCGINSDLVEFVSDTTPLKQGKFTPGAHLPVRPHADFAADYPDCALLFAWNHAAEVMAKEVEFQQQGGEWLVFVPRVARMNAEQVAQTISAPGPAGSENSQ